MHRKLLLAPGPTPIPQPALLAMAKDAIHHRSPEFRTLFGKVRAQLRWLYETEHDVITLTCSGTGAFEAAMINFTRREDTVIAITGGKFGERWAKVAKAYGMKVVTVDCPWGEAIDVARVEEALRAHPEAAMVTVSACETSTGVFHNVEAIAGAVRTHGRALLAVDGITAVGVHRIPMDALGIDLLVSGSQKAFGVPPGLAFVGVSPRAWERYPEANHPRFYFDLVRERDNQKDDQTAFTPAVSIVFAMHEVLNLMQAEGLEGLFHRQSQNARATRAGVEAMGLALFAKAPCDAVTAAVMPEGIDAAQVVRRMRDHYGVTIAGGQDHLKPTVLRLGHIGFFDRMDILAGLSTLELALVDQGHPLEPGTALVAAQRVYREG